MQTRPLSLLPRFWKLCSYFVLGRGSGCKKPIPKQEDKQKTGSGESDIPPPIGTPDNPNPQKEAVAIKKPPREKFLAKDESKFTVYFFIKIDKPMSPVPLTVRKYDLKPVHSSNVTSVWIIFCCCLTKWSFKIIPYKIESLPKIGIPSPHFPLGNFEDSWVAKPLLIHRSRTLPPPPSLMKFSFFLCGRWCKDCMLLSAKNGSLCKATEVYFLLSFRYPRTLQDAFILRKPEKTAHRNCGM